MSRSNGANIGRCDSGGEGDSGEGNTLEDAEGSCGCGCLGDPSRCAGLAGSKVDEVAQEELSASSLLKAVNGEQDSGGILTQAPLLASLNLVSYSSEQPVEEDGPDLGEDGCLLRACPTWPC